MDFVFADDAVQKNPTRPGMAGHELLALGGLYVPGEAVAGIEKTLEALCADNGFPARGNPDGLSNEFKWSPGRECWMASGLVGAARESFFNGVLAILAEGECQVYVVVSDTTFGTATNGALTPSDDVLNLFLAERTEWVLKSHDTCGVVVADRPSGGRTDESRFLVGCLDTLEIGTEYVLPAHVAFNVVTTNSRFVRLLQAADVVTSCTLARVSGESVYSPSVFARVVPLMPKGYYDVYGGTGLKIHPSNHYANLYHWLLGDELIWRGGLGYRLPLPTQAYATAQDVP